MCGYSFTSAIDNSRALNKKYPQDIDPGVFVLGFMIYIELTKV